MKKICEKIPYDSLEEAREDMETFEVDEKHTHRPIRAYRCDCGKYHLTSRDSVTATKRNINKRDARIKTWDEPSIPEIMAQREKMKLPKVSKQKKNKSGKQNRARRKKRKD